MEDAGEVEGEVAVKRVKRKSPEEILHRAVAAYLAVALKPPTFWTTFPAGGGGAARGGKLKAMGLVAGVPDILVFHPCDHGMVRVVAIELKSGDGSLSIVQRATHAEMVNANVRCRVAWSLDHVYDILKANGIPTFAKPAAGGGYRVAAD